MCTSDHINLACYLEVPAIKEPKETLRFIHQWEAVYSAKSAGRKWKKNLFSMDVWNRELLSRTYDIPEGLMLIREPQRYILTARYRG